MKLFYESSFVGENIQISLAAEFVDGEGRPVMMIGLSETGGLWIETLPPYQRKDGEGTVEIELGRGHEAKRCVSAEVPGE